MLHTVRSSSPEDMFMLIPCDIFGHTCICAFILLCPSQSLALATCSGWLCDRWRSPVSCLGHMGDFILVAFLLITIILVLWLQVLHLGLPYQTALIFYSSSAKARQVTEFQFISLKCSNFSYLYKAAVVALLLEVIIVVVCKDHKMACSLHLALIARVVWILIENMRSWICLRIIQ